MGYWKRTDNRRVDDNVYVSGQDEPISGRPLRFLLVDILASSRETLTIDELVEELTQLDAPLAGRASKVVSDALRWEVRNGRVERCGRGVYRFSGAPASTRVRISRRANSIRKHLNDRAVPTDGDGAVSTTT